MSCDKTVNSIIDHLTLITSHNTLLLAFRVTTWQMRDVIWSSNNSIWCCLIFTDPITWLCLPNGTQHPMRSDKWYNPLNHHLQLEGRMDLGYYLINLWLPYACHSSVQLLKVVRSLGCRHMYLTTISRTFLSADDLFPEADSDIPNSPDG